MVGFSPIVSSKSKCTALLSTTIPATTTKMASFDYFIATFYYRIVDLAQTIKSQKETAAHFNSNVSPPSTSATQRNIILPKALS